MRLAQTTLVAAALCAAAALPCCAADDSRASAQQANIEKALQSETNTLVFWQSLGNGTVREKRSGMTCAGELSPDMPLDFLSGPVPASTMSVVGCIYRSADNSRVVHILLSPNLLGAAETRKMARLAFEYTDKNLTSLGTAPIPDMLEGEEEGLTSIAAGKDKLHYLASAPVESWFVMVHTIAPRPDPIDLKQSRVVPVNLLMAALADISRNGKAGRGMRSD